MRISSQTIYDVGVGQIGSLQSGLARIQQQLSTHYAGTALCCSISRAVASAADESLVPRHSSFSCRKLLRTQTMVIHVHIPTKISGAPQPMITHTKVANSTCAKVSMLSCQYPILRISINDRATNTVSPHLRRKEC